MYGGLVNPITNPRHCNNIKPTRVANPTPLLLMCDACDNDYSPEVARHEKSVYQSLYEKDKNLVRLLIQKGKDNSTVSREDETTEILVNFLRSRMSELM